jgi:hypothetical protein
MAGLRAGFEKVWKARKGEAVVVAPSKRAFIHVPTMGKALPTFCLDLFKSHSLTPGFHPRAGDDGCESKGGFQKEREEKRGEIERRKGGGGSNFWF